MASESPRWRDAFGPEASADPADKTASKTIIVGHFLRGMSKNRTDIVVQQFGRTAKGAWSLRRLYHQDQAGRVQTLRPNRNRQNHQTCSN